MAHVMATSESQLLAITSRMEDIHRIMAATAEDVRAEGRDDIAAELDEIERSIAVVARRLLRISRSFRT